MAAHSTVHGLKSTARPITVTDFVNTLLKIWAPSGTPTRGASETLGLAISGGVDSMALAALCSQMQSDFPKYRQSQRHQGPLQSLHKVDFKAFIVNHGVRTGSATEAQKVARILDARGIKTKVLDIKWPAYDTPAEAPNFESSARRHRYQILGRACRDHGIRSLLLAHHEDDQVETIITRLIGGHRKNGFSGMQTDAAIPECFGIHGVHESGGLPDLPPDHKEKTVLARSSKPIPETGGIRMYRPFLDSGKEQLIATCKAEGIEWFDDPTNNDPTLTTRNAIRSMYKSHVMPAALQKPALLKMMRRCQQLARTQRAEVHNCLQQCDIKGFDTRSGVLKIQFNDMGRLSQQTDSSLIAAKTLKRIISLVTSRNHLRTSTLLVSTQHVFPELFPSKTLSSSPKPFTAGGVHFQPLIEHDGSKLSKKCEWRLSRQPLLRSASYSIVVPPSENSSWSKWALFDGRFWIRIRNCSGRDVVIREFKKEDQDRFKLLKRAVLRNFLKDVAPGTIRYTLPCILQTRDDGQETVLALPSVNISTKQGTALVQWEVRYKKIDTEGLSIVI